MLPEWLDLKKTALGAMTEEDLCVMSIWMPLCMAWGGDSFPMGCVCSVGEWPQGQKGDLIK